MKLDTTVRTELVDSALECLKQAVPDSTVLLRGSLATNTADPYSDIDVLWQVPDLLFKPCVSNLRETLSQVHQVASLRFDPAFQKSQKRRLAFVRFENVPLFWRLDLEIFAQSIHGDTEFDCHNPDARGSDWSAEESALMNAVGAIKAHLRGSDEDALQLIIRAYERLGLDFCDNGLRALIVELVNKVRAQDPGLHRLAQDIDELVRETF